MFCFRTTYNNLNTTKKSTELVFMLPLIKLMKSGLEVLELFECIRITCRVIKQTAGSQLQSFGFIRLRDQGICISNQF